MTNAIRAVPFRGIRAFLIFLLVDSAVAYAQPAPVPTGQPTGNEAKIHATYEAFARAWNAHDPAAMAALWTEQGDHMEPDGRTVFGRDQVAKLFGFEHASVFKDSQLHLAVERVRMVSDDVAVVDGTYELFGAVDPEGRKIGVRAGYFTSVVKNEDGSWKVSANRLMLPQVLIWRVRD